MIIIINNDVDRLPGNSRFPKLTHTWAAVFVAAVLSCLACAPVSAVTVTRGPYLQLGTPSSIIVRWRTDTSTNSVVSYGTSVNNLSSTVTDGNSTNEHIVQLSGLQAGTRYYYAIGSSSGMLAGSGDASYSFVTSPSPGTAIPTRIWAIGDSGSTSAYTANVYNAYLANTQAENTRTHAWLMLGDNAYTSGTDAQYQAAVFNMFPQLLRQVPVWLTQGNDEDTSNGATQTGTYYDNFSLPKAGEAGGVPSGSEAYYSFDYGNIHFISLNSFDVDRSPGGAMLTWLTNDLAATHTQWIIAFWHHPPYSKGSHDSDQSWETWQVEMRSNVLPILESYGVDLVLSGHSHSYERSRLLNGHYGYSDTLNGGMLLNAGDGREDGNGAYTKPDVPGTANEGAVYVVAGSSSFTNSDYPLDHPAMYIGLATIGSLILDIDGGRLEARFLDRYGVVQDHFTMTKPDTTAPVILEARTCNAASVTLEFAERLNEASAEALTNYAIGNGISISGAALNSDARTVTLNVSTLQPSFPYVLTVNNVMDLTGNAVVSNTQVPFTYRPCVTLDLQDGVSPTAAYQGTRDTYLDESNSNANFGSGSVLKTSGSPSDLSTLLQWDVSSIAPGSRILSASLTLNITDTSSSNYYLYEVLRDWKENEATWNNAAAGTRWNVPGAAGSDRGSAILLGVQGKSSGKLTLPLNARGLAVIQDWVDGVRQNRGFVLARGASSNELDFSSRENTTATNRPKLTIVYADAAAGGGNVPPTAAYSDSCVNLGCSFTDTSTDGDGSIAARLWNFGDGTSSTAQNPTHTFAAGGSYTVNLTVTDDDGASAGTARTVTVTDPNAPPLAPGNLSASVQTLGKGTTRTLLVTLAWRDNSGNETSFVLERCTQIGKGRTSVCNYAPLATLGANVTTYIDQTAYGNYRYRVRAYNANGYSAYSNEVSI